MVFILSDLKLLDCLFLSKRSLLGLLLHLYAVGSLVQCQFGQFKTVLS